MRINVKFLSISSLVFTSVIGFLMCWMYFSVRESGSVNECLPLVANQKIEKAGKYCLREDISVELGLVVTADFVTIDLGGHQITGPIGNTTAIGIASSGSNIHIMNGRIKGFGLGIQIYTDPLDPSRGFHQVDNVTISDSSQGGLHVIGAYSRILKNTITNIGGGPLLPGVHTHAVYVSGPGAIIQDNIIRDVYGSDIRQKAEGIALAVSGYINGALVTGNTIENSDLLPSGRWKDMSPSTYALWVGGNGLGSATVYGNYVSNYVNGIIADYHVTAAFISNTTKDVAIPLSFRGARRKYGENIASGVEGYIPDIDGNSRPFGATVEYGNSCENINMLAFELSKIKKINGCIADYDISFDELMSAL